jgi:hypothetical protein
MLARPEALARVRVVLLVTEVEVAMSPPLLVTTKRLFP